MSRLNELLDYVAALPLRESPPPCLWVQDLDDVLSASGQLAVAAIRAKCDCAECTSMRQVFVVGEGA